MNKYLYDLKDGISNNKLKVNPDSVETATNQTKILFSNHYYGYSFLTDRVRSLVVWFDISGKCIEFYLCIFCFFGDIIFFFIFGMLCFCKQKCVLFHVLFSRKTVEPKLLF